MKHHLLFKLFFIIILFYCICLTSESSAQNVVINELMTSNASTIKDENGKYHDWLELYNSGKESVNLKGYGLSDNKKKPFKWVFPDISLKAGEYKIIWLSNKNRTNPKKPLHTNFKVQSSGEKILLTNRDGDIVDLVPAVSLTKDVSYGRKQDAIDTWCYFREATPGSANIAKGYNEILAPVQFSQKGGFYTNEFDLTLTHNDPATTIIYTLDGSEPDVNNLNGKSYIYKNQYPKKPSNPFGDTLYLNFQSHSYSGPIHIHDRSSEPDKLSQISTTPDYEPNYFPSAPVRKGMVVRAIAFKSDAISSSPITNSFFVSPLGNPYKIPVISLTIQEDLLFDYHKGLFVPGIDFDNWRSKNPTEKRSNLAGNYKRKTEYASYLEYFDASSSFADIKQDVGIRIHGGTSRTLKLKNLRLYPRKRYNGKKVIQYRLFTETVPYASNPDNDLYKRILLRGQGYGGPFLRDIISNKLMQPVYHAAYRTKPAILFINGEYYGITTIRDRFDKYHLAYHYDLDPDNIEITKNAGIYKDVKSIVLDRNMADENNFTLLKNKFDIATYVDYLFMNIYLGKGDWSAKVHFGFWRVRKATDDNYGDGKWRAYTWDWDHKSAEDPEKNWLIEALDGADTNKLFLRKLLENNNFKYYFINRFADHINTTFTPSRVKAIVEAEYSKIEPYLPEFKLRWNSDLDTKETVDQYIKFGNDRPAIQRNQLREQFNTGEDRQVILDVNDTIQGHIRINSIEITNKTLGVNKNVYPWTGIYFQNVPIEVEAIANKGYKFSHWEGSISGQSQVIKINPEENLNIKACFIKL